MSIEYLCKKCGRSFPRYNSLQTLCGLCTVNKLHTSKPMKRIGKVGKQWIETRKQWIIDHPPQHNGKWRCALQISPQCLKYIDIDQLTLDHVIARSKRPDLRYDETNLVPACLFCNTEKSSKSIDLA